MLPGPGQSAVAAGGHAKLPAECPVEVRLIAESGGEGGIAKGRSASGEGGGGMLDAEAANEIDDAAPVDALKRAGHVDGVDADGSGQIGDTRHIWERVHDFPFGAGHPEGPCGGRATGLGSGEGERVDDQVIERRGRR